MVFLIVAIILLIIVFAGLFTWKYGTQYQQPGSFIAALAALLLFLMAINVLRF